MSNTHNAKPFKTGRNINASKTSTLPTESTSNRKRGRQSVTVDDGVLRAVGYVRVSTGEQADSGLGLESQRQKIQAQCMANGWELTEIFEDAGFTAKHLDRPGLRSALDSLSPGRVLVVLKLDRLTRSVRDLYNLTNIIEGAGADWASVTEKFDTTTASGRLILGVMVQLSQWERETISERTVDALAIKKQHRQRLGTTPLGYQTIERDDGSKVIVEDTDEQITVKLIRELHNDGKGLSLRKIAAFLTENDYRTKKGGSWEAATVARILKPRYVETI